MSTLHYIYDPLCGWYYAGAPLLAAAEAVPGLEVALHGGGMLTGPHRRRITPQWREHVLPHDRRIAELSGQPFGEAYIDGLLNDTQAVLDSEPPTTAILAAESLGGRGADMLRRLQRAHYVEGRRISEWPVLEALAGDLGLDAAAFRQAVAEWSGEPTRRHIEDSRHLLEQVGGRGFPTWVLVRDDGSALVMDAARWLGQPQGWGRHLAEVSGGSGRTEA